MHTAGIQDLRLYPPALCGGHVSGLALAHDRALVLFGDTRSARETQRWMLAVMVTFTCLGLWLLSAVNT